jgi:hypothetical protein
VPTPGSPLSIIRLGVFAALLAIILLNNGRGSRGVVTASSDCAHTLTGAANCGATEKGGLNRRLSAFGLQCTCQDLRCNRAAGFALYGRPPHAVIHQITVPARHAYGLWSRRVSEIVPVTRVRNRARVVSMAWRPADPQRRRTAPHIRAYVLECGRGLAFVSFMSDCKVTVWHRLGRRRPSQKSS